MVKLGASSCVILSLAAATSAFQPLAVPRPVGSTLRSPAPPASRAGGASTPGYHQGYHQPHPRGWLMAAVAADPSKTTVGPGPAATGAGALHSAAGAGQLDLKKYLGEKKEMVEAALDASLQVTCPEVAKITESMRYSLLAGGKRIRPIMCIAACEMAGGTAEMAMPTAVALEMIHTMSLIHDDLPSMDNDSLRRGKPTNHVIYGEDVAILAGDALLSTAFEHVAKHTPKSVPAERIVEVISRLGASVGATGLAGGQVMDLECEGKAGVGLKDLTWIHTHKTAALLKVSVAAGVILAGASPEEVKACETYALDIGLAFQVADDILDVTASTEALGKTAGKDLNMDKTTYPKLMGLDGARQEARRLVVEAKAALDPFGPEAAALLAIADYIVEREN